MDELKSARERIDRIDGELARLWEARLAAVRVVAEEKQKRGLPIADAAREAEILRARGASLADASLLPFYRTFQEGIFRASRDFQASLLSVGAPTEFPLPYPVRIGRSILADVAPSLGAYRRILLVTDDGVPAAYRETLLKNLPNAAVLSLPAGERSKDVSHLQEIWQTLLRLGFTRHDAIVALGGGVVGDLAGFAAATYMRGIALFLIPTTLLSAVDASVGGKNAIDFDGVKNSVGTFYRPSAVFIDPTLFASLPARALASGMAEIVKIAATSDAELFAALEAQDAPKATEAILSRAILNKAKIVEQDEKEASLRRVLNFGHTLGHAIEASADGALLHGECVALGMLPMCAPEVRTRLVALYRKIGLPTAASFDSARAASVLRHDKKADADGIETVFVPRIGQFTFEKKTADALSELLKEVLL